MEENFNLIVKGGIVMVPIFLVSFYMVYVVVLKAWQFHTSKALDTKAINEILTQMKIDDWSGAEQRLTKDNSPVAVVMLKALKLIHYKDLPRERIEPEIERVGLIELEKLKSNLRGLELVAGIAPLMGLLGTVTGMVKAFAKLAESTARIDPSMLAGGIWEALITTVAGLVVAIPAYFAYYIFTAKVDSVRLIMHDAVTQVLNLQKPEVAAVAVLAPALVAEAVPEAQPVVVVENA